jgi:hypothetical protein
MGAPRCVGIASHIGKDIALADKLQKQGTVSHLVAGAAGKDCHRMNALARQLHDNLAAADFCMSDV